MLRLASLSAATLLAGLGAGLAADPTVLQVVAPWEIGGLDPARSGYVFARMQVAETLLGADDGGRPVPQLAAAWTRSADGLSWRFALRPGARFHDGSAVTGAAVAASLERARQAPAVLANVPVVAVTAEDGAVTVTTSRPFASLPAFLAHSSTIILAPSASDAAGAVRRIVATGPFRVTGLAPPLKLDVARFDGWWGVAPAIAAASYLAVPRGETRAAMAESGQGDLVTVLAPETLARARRNPQIAVTVLPIPRTRAIKLNAASPYFADLRARQAVSLAIDRRAIAAALLRNPEIAATQMFPPTLAEWHVPDLAALGHDPAAARSLLAEAGWRAGPDGVLAKDGRPFRVTLRTFSDRPEQPPMAAAIQAQLRAVGIDMQIAITNSSEIPAGHRDGSLEMALFARNFSLVPDPLGTLLQDFGPQGGDWGAMGWSSPQLARLLEALSGVEDAAERARLRREVAAILQAELPVLPVAWFDYAVAANRRIAGVTIDPLELSFRIAAMRWAQ